MNISWLMEILFLTSIWTVVPQQKELQSAVMSISHVTISIIPVAETMASILEDPLRTIKTSNRMFYQMLGSMKTKSWHHAPDCQAGVHPVTGPPSRICQRINETKMVNLAIRYSNSCWNRNSILMRTCSGTTSKLQQSEMGLIWPKM